MKRGAVRRRPGVAPPDPLRIKAMSRSASISAFAEQEATDVESIPTVHELVLELADPPLEDFHAFCAIVNESKDATERAVAEVR